MCKNCVNLYHTCKSLLFISCPLFNFFFVISYNYNNRHRYKKFCNAVINMPFTEQREKYICTKKTGKRRYNINDVENFRHVEVICSCISLLFLHTYIQFSSSSLWKRNQFHAVFCTQNDFKEVIS